MKPLSTCLALSWLSLFGSIFILIGCGDETRGTPPPVIQVKEVDRLEFLRDVNPEYASEKRLLAKAFAGGKEESFRATGGYLQGIFGKPSKSDQAIAYLTSAAEAGDWEAMYVLYRSYGLTSLKNVEKQDHWGKAFSASVVKAANGGEAKAMVRLGYEYSFGLVIAKDEIQSCNWFRKAANAGDVIGELHAGRCLLNSKGGLDEGIRLLTSAADKGNGEAMADLLKVFRSQRPDKKIEKTYFDLMMSLTSPDESSGPYFAAGSYCLVGVNYSSGCKHPNSRNLPFCKKCSEEDLQRSISLYQKAAELGNASAARKLGDIYEKVEGDNSLTAETVHKWNEKAAELGDTSAQFKVGSSYLYGLGATPKDVEKAADWLTKSAKRGWGEAQGLLGLMYAKGVGVPEDSVLAYAWLNLAVANLTGSYYSKARHEAESLRNGLEKGMTPEQMAEAQRLASNWNYGQPLVSGGVAGGTSKSGTLIKKMTGTVFVVSKSGYAITNQHVVQGCKELRIEGREGVAKQVTEDTVNDLALIQISGDVKVTAMIAVDSARLRQGEDIVVFGFPLNAVLSSGGNLTPGVVSALTGLGNNTNQIQITAPIQPGSSGSPVLNKKGEVVGVVSMKLSDSKMAKATGSVGQNVNFAVGGQTLKSFLDAHKVEYRSGGLLSFEKSTDDLADEARKWTSVIECWK